MCGVISRKTRMTNKYLVLPNFIIFGAMRCGSTTLHNLISQHPEVFMSPVRKELNFFFGMLQGKLSIKDYSGNFIGSSGQKIIGESSISYIYHRPFAKVIRQNLPDVKLVCILRNPAIRAYSNYLWTLNRGREWLHFEDAISQENERVGDIADTPYIAYYSYVQRGFYANQLQHYLQYFSEKEIYCLLLEDLMKNSKLEMEKLCNFLEIDTGFEFQMIEKGAQGANTGQFPIYPQLVRALAYLRYKKASGKRFLWRFDRLLGDIQKSIPRRNQIPPLSNKTYQELIKIFKNDVLALVQLGYPSATQWLEKDIR